MVTLTSASIDQYLKSLSVHGASEHTIRAYKTDLRGWLTWMKQQEAMDLEVSAASYLTTHRSTWSPKTTLRRLTAMRGWARHHGLPEFLASYRGPTPAPTDPTPLEHGIPAVVAMACATTKPQRRALVALCGLCGLRVGEACAVRPEHIDVAQKRLEVIGKGDKRRRVPISKAAWELIRPAFELARTNESTLVGVNERQARRVITLLGRKCGFDNVASHMLRKTFATAALDKTRDVAAVQDLLGHASPATTRIYTRTSDERMREAVEVV